MKRTRALYLCLAALCLQACVNDLRSLGSLQPLGEGRFVWQTFSDAVFPEDSPEAEKQRLEQLALVMQGNPPCNQGYVVESRTATLRLGFVYDIFYTIDCG